MMAIRVLFMTFIVVSVGCSDSRLFVARELSGNSLTPGYFIRANDSCFQYVDSIAFNARGNTVIVYHGEDQTDLLSRDSIRTILRVEHDLRSQRGAVLRFILFYGAFVLFIAGLAEQ